MLADTHIHLQDYKAHKIKDVVNAAQKNNVGIYINPSSHPDDWLRVAAIAQEYQTVIPAFGIHPWYINSAPEDWTLQLENMLKKYPQAFVGECGIDSLKNPDIQLQISILQQHIALAHKYNRIIIVHAVKADSALMPLLDTFPQKTIFHSYTGSAEWGKILQNKGFWLGLNFSILRKKNAPQIINSLNLKQILLETDGPYQNLTAESGETLPQNLPLLAEKIAQIKQIPLAKFLQILHANFQHFIGEK